MVETEIQNLATEIIYRDLHKDLVVQELGCTEQENEQAQVIVATYHLGGYPFND